MEAAILNLLSNFSSPILEEFGLLWGMEKERHKIKSNLLTIKAVLLDAEEQQVKKEAMKDWHRKLKDVAYDADDLVDEFMVEALKRKVEIRDGMQKKVRSFFSPSNPLVFRIKMAHKMQDLRERLDEIAKENNDFHFKGGVPADDQPRISSTSARETHSYVDESEVYGRDDEKAKIIDSLINAGEDEVLFVISIVGMGGLGKTTLAQLVYNDESVAAHFELKIWVYVSDQHFDIKRIMREILQNDRSDTLSMEQLQISLRDKLGGKKYLLVLDDVWNEVHEKWDGLKTLLKCGAQGSKIVVTTRSETVASIMGARPAHTHHLPLLSVNDSWTLFEKLAHPDLKFVSIGKKMVKKCGGVALAIKTLGGLMSSKRSESEWLSVSNSELWELQDTEGILPALRLSYNHLTPHLKQCFAYCAVCPKGYPIHKDKLIKQWVAQGFIQFGNGNKLFEEERGEDFFNDLLSRSLFQVMKENGQMKYKMHDLIHDLLKDVAGTESIIVKEVFTQVVPNETRHLTLCGYKWATELRNLEAQEKCKKLRSILLPSRYGFIDVNICSHFRSLKVLDLSWRNIRYLPNSISKLKHLRYLDISHTKIHKLPKAICNLHSLQTLILDGIPIKKLPKDIKRMTSLRHIECKSIKELTIPNGIGELTCLQTLQKFTISQEGAGIEELKRLNQLQGELCIERLENVRNEKCASEAKLMEKQRVCSLSLSWSDVETITDSRVNLDNHVIENLEPHSNLKELSILKYMGLNIPSWIEKLTKLVKISLSNCNNYEHLSSLGQLRLLEALEISNMESLKYIFVFEEAYKDKDIFPSLKELDLSHMPSLEGWWPHQVGNEERREERHEQVLLGCLRRLLIIDCPKLIQLPKLLSSPALEWLELRNVGCERIEMPYSQSLKALKKVHLSDMQHLEEILLQQAHDLEELHVQKCPRMMHLPNHLPSLKRLKIRQCNEMLLEFVPKYLLLDELSITGLEIDDCPKLVSLSDMLKNLSTLKSLSISDFPDLMLLPDELKCLGSLKTLSITRSCLKQTSISGVPHSLRTLDLWGCKNLECLYFDGLPNLTSIGSFGCPKLWSFSSDWVRNLTSLGQLGIGDVESFSELFGNLTSLYFLSIYNCTLPKSIGNLTSLTSLAIYCCHAMRSLPESVGNLISLKFLQIDGCPEMRVLPESIRNLKSLYSLEINDCPEMGTLPVGLQSLTNLQKLTINNCPILKRRLLDKKKIKKGRMGEDLHKVAHVPDILIDERDPREVESSDESNEEEHEHKCSSLLHCIS